MKTESINKSLNKIKAFQVGEFQTELLDYLMSLRVEMLPKFSHNNGILYIGNKL